MSSWKAQLMRMAMPYRTRGWMMKLGMKYTEEADKIPRRDSGGKEYFEILAGRKRS